MRKNGSSVLLVEDERNYLKSAFRLLSTFSVRVSVLEHGRQAWDYLFGPEKGNLPNLVIMPLDLPEYTGVGIVHKMRIEDATKDIPVIILVNSSEEQELFRQFNFPFSFSFVKPLTFANLVHAFPALNMVSNSSTHFRLPQPIVSTVA